MKAKHYIGVPYGRRVAEIFLSDHTPSREEIGTRFSQVLGPYKRTEAIDLGKSTFGPVSIIENPLEKKGA